MASTDPQTKEFRENLGELVDLKPETKKVNTRLGWIIGLSLLILTFIFFQVDYTDIRPSGLMTGEDTSTETDYEDDSTSTETEDGHSTSTEAMPTSSSSRAQYCCNGYPPDECRGIKAGTQGGCPSGSKCVTGEWCSGCSKYKCTCSSPKKSPSRYKPPSQPPSRYKPPSRVPSRYKPPSRAPSRCRRSPTGSCDIYSTSPTGQFTRLRCLDSCGRITEEEICGAINSGKGCGKPPAFHSCIGTVCANGYCCFERWFSSEASPYSPTPTGIAYTSSPIPTA